MPGVSKQTAQLDDHGIVEDRHAELDGYTVNFVTHRQTIDHAPLLKGLPNDQCTCPHWGYVFKGEISYLVDGVKETHRAGDAFYIPPGHIPTITAGTEMLQFSPSKELAEIEPVLLSNVQKMMGA